MKSNPKWGKEQQQAFQKAWAKVVVKAWNDPAFKERLMKDPVAVLKEHGIEFPAGKTCQIIENTEKIVYLNLPHKPEGVLSETQLKEAVGGGEGTCESTSSKKG